METPTISLLIAGEGTLIYDGRQPVSLKLISSRTWQAFGNVLACYGVEPKTLQTRQPFKYETGDPPSPIL